MLNFHEIKNQVSKQDFNAVAEATGYKVRTVRAIVNGERKDKRKVQLAFNILLNQRIQLKWELKSTSFSDPDHQKQTLS